MRKERMTEAEYTEAKQEIERIKAEIEVLRKEKNKLVNKVRWYEYTEDKLSTKYEDGFSYEYFGKRYKDLTKEELKEYNRMSARRCRSNHK